VQKTGVITMPQRLVYGGPASAGSSHGWPKSFVQWDGAYRCHKIHSGPSRGQEGQPSRLDGPLRHQMVDDPAQTRRVWF
jgi:hypothetical protein